MISKYYHPIFALALLVVVVSCAVSIGAITTRSAQIASMRQTLSRDAIDGRLANAFAELNDFPGSAGKDILFLRTLSSVGNLHNAEEWDEPILRAASADFGNFMKNNEAYKELYFIRKSNGCAVRVKRVLNATTSAQAGLPATALSLNKEAVGRWQSGADISSGTPCDKIPPAISAAYAPAHSLSLGEMYISPLTLYYGAPVFVYTTPVNDNCIIVSVVDANYFLEDIRRLARDGESIFLLDENGSYMAHYDRSKEKLFGGTGNFYNDFSDVAGGVLSDVNARRIETKKETFTFLRIYPTESNFALYEGANKLLGEKQRKKYFWVMASVSQRVHGSAWWLEGSYLAPALAVVVLHALVIVFFYFSLSRRLVRKEDLI